MIGCEPVDGRIGHVADVSAMSCDGFLDMWPEVYGN